MGSRCWLVVLVLVLGTAGCLGGGGITQFTLTMEIQGQGAVDPPVGDHTYSRNTVVVLTATPDDEWVFVRWDGDVADPSARVTEVVMDGQKRIKAVFAEAVDAGQQASHNVDGLVFHMRIAPAAVFPARIDDDGTAAVDTPFWMAETPVTYALWYAVKQWGLDNGYIFENAGKEGSHGDTGQPPSAKRNEPVTTVSWRDSIVWTNALSEMLEHDPVYTYQGIVIRDSTDSTACDNAVQESANGFRLPTSNEWELAARFKGDDDSHGAIFHGGLYWTPGSYASGATAAHNDAGANEEVAWYFANSGSSTKDVGLKRANGLNLYDMSGNVREWCFDQSGSMRVCRGGSWISAAYMLSVGVVHQHNPDYVFYEGGLRLARTAD